MTITRQPFKRFERIVALVILVIAFPILITAHTYSSSQDNFATSTCIGCAVSNPALAVGSDTSQYALMSLPAGLLEGQLVQNYHFPFDTLNRRVSLFLGTDNGDIVDATLLSNVTVETFLNGVSNGENFKVSSDSVDILTGTNGKFIFTMNITGSFDQVRLSLEAGLAGALNDLRVYGASHSTIGSVSLPIELISFNVEASSASEALVSWITASETNNDYFTVELSTDGINFTDADLVEGAGTTAESNNYSTEISLPGSTEQYYFRLKQTDFDGAYSYSSLVVLAIEEEDTEIKAYFTGTCCHFDIDSPHMGSGIELRIYDISASLIAIKRIGCQGEKVALDVDVNGTSVLIYSVKMGDVVKTGKLSYLGN